MPPRSWKIRIDDILAATSAVRRYVEGYDLGSFRADSRTCDAVLHNLQVIGEAAKHVPPEVRERHPEVPWQDMADMRNVLSHEYFGVDLEVVWRTATEDLPTLPNALEAVRREADADQG